MSGETHVTQIHVPTEEELAVQAAAEARGQGIAGVEIANPASIEALAAQRVKTLRFVIERTASIATPVPGTARSLGDHSAEVEVVVRGTRIPLRIDLQPGALDRATLVLPFAHAHGLDCATEAQIAAEIAALFTESVVRNPDDDAAADHPSDRSAG